MAGHMRLQVWRAHIYETHDGDRYPADEAPENATPTGTNGWFAQYSAPGYLDRTDPVGPCNTAVDAAREAFATYADSDDPADRAELAEMLRGIRRGVS